MEGYKCVNERLLHLYVCVYVIPVLHELPSSNLYGQ